MLTVGGVYACLSVVQLPVHIDLSLCDVASQVRDGMGDVWARGTRYVESLHLVLRDSSTYRHLAWSGWVSV